MQFLSPENITFLKLSNIMERKMDKEAVSRRIMETSRETERLKEELQNLIAAGIQGNLNLSVTTVISKSPPHSANKVQIIKSYDSQHSFQPNVASSEKEVLSPKKNKPYNVQQSREYIKKQREKRTAESKNKKSETKIALELKKEKLQELHQKANEIVKKNVEAKRQRSKSREPPIMRSRSASREVKPDLMASKPKTLHTQKDPRSKLQELIILRPVSANTEVNPTLKSNYSNEGVKKYDHPSYMEKGNTKELLTRSSHLISRVDNEIKTSNRNSIICGYNCAGRSKKYSSNTSDMNTRQTTEISTVQNSEHLFNSKSLATKNPNLLYPPDFPIKPLQEPEVTLGTQNYHVADRCKKPLNELNLCASNVDTDTSRNRGRSRRDIFLKDFYVNKQITSRKGSSCELQEQLKPITQSSKNVVLDDQEIDLTIHSNFNFKSHNDEKKITNYPQKQHDYPDWLRASAPQTDPHNFINTVRRQLKSAINEKKPPVIDVAIQNSVLSSLNSDKKNDLNSVLSHKRPNLDLCALDQIEIGAEHSGKEDKSDIKSGINSESDTSKNIPSISSESHTSSQESTVAKSSSKTTLKTGKSYSINEIIKAKTDFLAYETNSDRTSQTYSTISEKNKSPTKSIKLSAKSSKRSVIVSKPSLSDANSGNSEYFNKENLNHFSSKDAKRIIKTHADRPATSRNITVRSGNEQRASSKANQIHLKFEAEIHLLNDFNKSLRHFAEIEKEFESLRSRDDTEFMAKKIVLNRDTQTSVVNTARTDPGSRRNGSSRRVCSVNYSRGSIGSEEIPPLEVHKSPDNSDLNVMELESKMEEIDTDDLRGKGSSTVQISSQTVSKRSTIRCANDENNLFRNFAGISLKMFDQLINDEDVRIENLKKIVKIREQVLLDKTRSELVWLEMQKKQFIENKRFEDAALIKRKQRAILLKHQEERLEMQRLKQMQRETSRKRKTALKQQRDGIKHQLHSGSMLSIIKSSGRDRRERRSSGPLKVMQSNSIHSETSLSITAATGTDQEIKSITTRTHSMVNILSTHSDNKHTDLSDSVSSSVEPRKSISDSALTNMKQKLLMREKALAKRRKTVEELLQWHQKLLREEQAIEDLESQVKNIFTSIPSEKEDEVALNISSPSKEDEPPEMSKDIPQSTKDAVTAENTSNIDKYNTEFEADDCSSISSISQIIEGFNKIEDNILNFSLAYPEKNQLDEQNDKDVEYKKQELAKSTSSSVSTNCSNIASLQPAIEEPASDKSSIASIKLATNSLPQEDVCSVHIEIEGVSDESEIEGAILSEVDDEISGKNVCTSIEEVSEQRYDLSAVELVKEAPIKTVASASESVVNELQTENSIVQEISITKDDVHSDESIKSIQPVVQVIPMVDEISAKDVAEDLNSSAESHSASDETHCSASQLNQDVPELIVVNECTPSTSDHTREQVIPEVKVQCDVLEEDTPSSLRQYSENKTDEEKVASLSTRTSSRDQSFISCNEENASHAEEKILTEEIIEVEPEPNHSSTSSMAPNEEIQEDLSVSQLESCVDEIESVVLSQKLHASLEENKISVSIQEISEDASTESKTDKRPKVQEDCVMSDHLLSPSKSPEPAESPLDEKKTVFLGNEAEELLRKQLAIEQEIKILTEQQQKEQLSLVYMREIPNKPPPPYTPPSKSKTVKVVTVIPSTKDEIQQITEYSAKIIHKAYISNNLDNISISDKTLSLIAKNINKGCYKYVFNLCKDIAIDYYGQFLDETPGPSWMRPEERSFSIQRKPLDGNGLQQLMNKKLLELFGFQKQEVNRENAIMKWSRKKRDHVDEVLIREMQAEEKTWTNIDQDELLVKNRITNEIMDLLLKDTAQVLKKSLSLKNENIALK